MLATLDTATLEARMNEADAQVAQAEAQLAKLRNGNRAQDIAQARSRVTAAAAIAANAQRDYTRRQPLVEPGAISRDMWEQTVADRDRAECATGRGAPGAVAAGGGRAARGYRRRRRPSCAPPRRPGAARRPTGTIPA